MHDGKRRRIDSYMQRNKSEKCKGKTREGKGEGRKCSKKNQFTRFRSARLKSGI
jgi:hypothetical protein